MLRIYSKWSFAFALFFLLAQGALGASSTRFSIEGSLVSEEREPDSPEPPPDTPEEMQRKLTEYYRVLWYVLDYTLTLLETRSLGDERIVVGGRLLQEIETGHHFYRDPGDHRQRVAAIWEVYDKVNAYLSRGENHKSGFAKAGRRSPWRKLPKGLDPQKVRHRLAELRAEGTSGRIVDMLERYFTTKIKHGAGIVQEDGLGGISALGRHYSFIQVLGSSQKRWFAGPAWRDYPYLFVTLQLN